MKERRQINGVNKGGQRVQEPSPDRRVKCPGDEVQVLFFRPMVRRRKGRKNYASARRLRRVVDRERPIERTDQTKDPQGSPDWKLLINHWVLPG
jgi:hypothetical protein